MAMAQWSGSSLEWRRVNGENVEERGETEKREWDEGQTLRSLFCSASWRYCVEYYCIMLASLRSVARPLARCATAQGKLNQYSQ